MITYNSHFAVKPCEHCGTNHVLRFVPKWIGGPPMAECPIEEKMIRIDVKTGQMEFATRMDNLELTHV